MNKYGNLLERYLDVLQDSLCRLSTTEATYLSLRELRLALYDVVQKCLPGDFVSVGMDTWEANVLAAAMLVHERDIFLEDHIPYQERRVVVAASRNYLQSQYDKSWEMLQHFGLFRTDVVKLIPDLIPCHLSPTQVHGVSILLLGHDSEEASLEALTDLYPKIGHGGYVITTSSPAKSALRLYYTTGRHDFHIRVASADVAVVHKP